MSYEVGDGLTFQQELSDAIAFIKHRCVEISHYDQEL